MDASAYADELREALNEQRYATLTSRSATN